jgi:hypothetical protein
MNSKARNLVRLGILLYLFLFIFSSYCKCGLFEKIKTIIVDVRSSNNKINIVLESILKLETTENSLIGGITSIAFYKDRIFVFDRSISHTLFVFDKSGKFLNKLKRGRGPDEIIDPWDFCIDEENNTILLWDQQMFNLNFYDLNLAFIKSIKCPALAIRDFDYLGNNSFLILSQFYPIEDGKPLEKVAYDYFVYANNFKTLKSKIHISNPKSLNTPVLNAICKTKTKFFLAPFDYNIYKLDGENAYPVYRLDFGRYKITEEELEKGSNYFKPEINEGTKMGLPFNLFINGKYISFTVLFRNEQEFYIYNKETNIGFFSDNPTLKLQIPKCQIKGLFDDNTFISVVNVADLNEWLIKTKQKRADLKPLDIMSNQVIMMFKIK